MASWMDDVRPVPTHVPGHWNGGTGAMVDIDMPGPSTSTTIDGKGTRYSPVPSGVLPKVFFLPSLPTSSASALAVRAALPAASTRCEATCRSRSPSASRWAPVERLPSMVEQLSQRWMEAGLEAFEARDANGGGLACDRARALDIVPQLVKRHTKTTKPAAPGLDESTPLTKYAGSLFPPGRDEPQSRMPGGPGGDDLQDSRVQGGVQRA